MLMLKTQIHLLLLASIAVFSCGRSQDPAGPMAPETGGAAERPVTLMAREKATPEKGQYTNTKWVYEDADGRKLSIENSLPRGGLSYTAPNGEEFVYAVFWNRISNDTDSSYEIELDFYEEKYELVSSPGRIFTIHMPPDTMTEQQKTELITAWKSCHT